MTYDYIWFKKEILILSGIDLNSYKEKQMKRRIDSLICKNGYEGYDGYVRELKVNKELYSEFINYLTINVSEFYRNPDQWSVLEKEIIPTLLNKTRKLKIWSAACSTGDEPYTLVMVLNKYIPLSDIRIIATDIDRGALEKAMRGIYTDKSLESLPNDYMKKYFAKNSESLSPIKGDSYKIKDEVKACVEFRQMNLLSGIYPSECDLIVCRNVLIYFTEEAKNIVYNNIGKALKNEGILFVGSTEQIITSNKYKFRPVRTFFYLKDETL